MSDDDVRLNVDLVLLDALVVEQKTNKVVASVKKEDFVLTEDGTKQGASRRYIMQAVEASLTRLKTDYIDLYQSHRDDPDTPIAN